MNPYQVHANALAQFEGTLGTALPTFVWSNKTWQIVPSSIRTGKPLAYGGFTLESDLHFTCLVNQFGTTAINLRTEMLDTTCVYLGDVYKITNVTIAPTGLQITVDADNVSKGA